MGDHGLIEQPLVSLLQRRQLHVAIDVPRQAIEIRHHPLHHLPRRRDVIGQQPGKAEAIPLPARKGDGLIHRLVAEDVEAAFHGVLMAWTMATTTGPHTVSTMLPIAYGTV